MAHDVFISYTKEDQSIADAACDALEAEGIKCWIAPRDVLASSDWGEAIINAIKQSRAMLLVFSSNANNSIQIKREVNHAVEQRLPVITFRVENVEPTGALEYYLDVTHWLDAVDPPREKQLRRLTEDVKRLLKEPQPPILPLPRRPLPLPKPHAFSKWLIGSVVGLLATVLIFIWIYGKSNGSGIAPVGTPTPAHSTSGSPAAVATKNPTDDPTSVVTTTPTPTPIPINTPGQLPDDTQERINKASDILGNPNTNEITAMNTIYSLEPLAKKSKDHQRSVVRILTLYIRKKAVWRLDGSNRAASAAPDDIKAAIIVIGYRSWLSNHDEPLDLRHTDLRGVSFSMKGRGRANFKGVLLSGAHLEYAFLWETDFHCADLSGAYMEGVDVSRTDFYGADLANIKGTTLTSDIMKVAWNIRTPKCAL